MSVTVLEGIVLEQIKLPHHHINAYHLSHSLLFQFILSEMLTAHQDVQVAVMKKNDFKTLLSKLTGSHQEFVKPMAWGGGDGTLSKLSRYCAYFSQFVDPADKKLRALHLNANKAWLIGLDCLHLIFDDRGLDEVQLELHKLSLAIKHLGRLVVKVIEEFADDENVIFFVLRHFEQFDEHFGNGFVAKLFKKMYKGGRDEAARMLSTKYSKRGFVHLLPIIATRMAEL